MGICSSCLGSGRRNRHVELAYFPTIPTARPTDLDLKTPVVLPMKLMPNMPVVKEKSWRALRMACLSRSRTAVSLTALANFRNLRDVVDIFTILPDTSEDGARSENDPLYHNLN
ncbi:MAG: hypothetical protein Q9219_000961 [cf. Caloplaca sp. 3 TL-2023]